MQVIACSNVNEALVEGLWLLRYQGAMTESRNGRVLRATGPVTTCYRRPWERVLFSPLRDANPFFHLYECAWMLAGRSDVESVAQYAKNMEMFANEDGILTGAYGARWRESFGFDQIREVVGLLKYDRVTRRAVLGMWDPESDLLTAGNSKDVPCNTHVYFDGSLGSLDMTVCNRSNDIVWGAYGANAVHMSFLHEFIACAAGFRIGTYYQMSNNYHLYLDRDDTERLANFKGEDREAWRVHLVEDNRYRCLPPPRPVMEPGTSVTEWLADAEQCAETPTSSVGLRGLFWRDVFAPMMRAHEAYKAGDFQLALKLADSADSADWSIAAIEWLKRRQLKKQQEAA